MTTYDRVFITGALGFVGRALADRYRSQGAEVVGVDISADAALGVVAGDTSETGPWQDAAAGCDLVVHTAALVTNTATDQRAWEVNVLGTRRALDAAIRGGARRFLHFSSVRAYSDVDFPDRVDETHPVRTDGHSYVDTKVASEQVVLQAHAAGEVACTVVRPGDVYGPGSRPWTLWPATAIAMDFFFLPDDGLGVFSPVYIDNLVDGVVLAAASADAAGQVFNLSDGVGVSNLDFFGHYFRMFGMEPALLPAEEMRRRYDEIARLEIEAGNQPSLNGEVVDYFERRGTYSIEKAQRVLGWEPVIDLAEGMRRTEHWLRESGLLG